MENVSAFVRTACPKVSFGYNLDSRLKFCELLSQRLTNNIWFSDKCAFSVNGLMKWCVVALVQKKLNINKKTYHLKPFVSPKIT